MTTLRKLYEHWDQEAAAYTFGAFWFWNSGLETEELRLRAQELARSGFRYVVIHPIHGMTLEYLSPAYCAVFRRGLELLRECGLKAWIYDEFGWPSGNAGGLLLRDYPECAGWHLAFLRNHDGSISAEPRRTSRRLDSVTGAPWCQGERGYLDTLSAEAVDHFIELTHQRLLDAAGEALFRDVVIGFFTDEPAAMLDNPGGHSLWEAEALPWTPELPRLFRERYGFAIEPHYAELAAPGDRELRRKYWNLTTELHVENFYGRIADWCHRHELLFTGHVGEDFPGQAARFCGDIRRCLERMDLPGIDYLGHPKHAAERIGEMTLVTSIARRTGKQRVFCEAFGVSPTTVTPEHLLAESQSMALFGVNDLSLMGMHQSLAGIRKHLYWPGFADETAWGPAFPTLNRAVGRSLALTSAGKKRIRYAILYPQDHLEQLPVMNYKVCDTKEPVFDTLETLFSKLRKQSENADFIFRADLERATLTADGRLTAGGEIFDALIAPDCFFYYPETAGMLSRLAPAVRTDVPEHDPDETSALAPELQSGAMPAVHRYRFDDGELTALNNGSNAPCRILCRAEANQHAALWNPVTGKVEPLHGEIEIPAWGTVYLSVSEHPIGQAERRAAEPAAPEHTWHAELAEGNCELLDDVQFRRPGGEWIEGESGATVPGKQRIPQSLSGETRIEFKASFAAAGTLEDCFLAFEHGRFAELRLDGVLLEHGRAVPCMLWDHSCRKLSCGSLPPGTHRLEGTLKIPAFESRIRNDGFFPVPPMPSLDLMLCGDFRRSAEGLIPFGTPAVTLPLDNRMLGLLHLPGALILKNEFKTSSGGRVLPLELSGNITASAQTTDGTEEFCFGGKWNIALPEKAGICPVRIALYPSGGTLFGAGTPVFGIRYAPVKKE